ncbi:hypothetical protein INT44_001395 [Umbelopsis vinacea]|uniref:propionyl-CoA carboxylase n=1 Tax=Umbelopsis vinacea TaxID=44442 RepID=A0A8H7QB73_9FUNG|nr:hypothetical protein INT44_001395 [Umbelopsis vinacea]
MLPRIVSSAALRSAVIGSSRRTQAVIVRRTAAVLPAPVIRNFHPTRSYVSSTKHRQAEYVNTVKEYGKTFDKILIANRGEIACRVIRSAKKMGIKTVAIHSDADANALHVQLADEAVNVGPAPTSQSYLSIPNILAAIRQTGAQAVHPGYGFLSENAHFVKALEAEGVVFIGPSESAMADMGDKIESKIIAKASGVNTIPGYNGVVESIEHAKTIAHDITYPVMIKASAGGGGKGMRIAWNDTELVEGYKLAKQESLSSFGDDRLLIEKYIDNPRHIEIQVLGDKHGNVIYLPERECSIQRRNQKVVEEAPSVHIDPETRRKMGEQAVALSKHVGYSSAGTVEFLADSQRNFYFLEMNTRLQVEHPITEYITGIDLVEQMIRSAAGQELSIKQEDVGIKGWAIESRVYAEDPEKYLPSIGRLTKYIEPRDDIGNVRCDSGIVEGSEISIYYDPMICKLVTYGPTRDQAIATMQKALDEYVIKGVTHNISLLREIVSHPRFQSGKISTKFLAEEYPEGFKGTQLDADAVKDLASISSVLWAKREVGKWAFTEGKGGASSKPPTEWSVWVNVAGGQNTEDNSTPITIRKLADDEFEVSSPTYGTQVLSAAWPLETPLAHALFKDTGKKLTVQYLDVLPLGFKIQHLGSKFDVTIQNERQHELSKYMIEKPKQDMAKFILSPMPGSVVSVAVKVGDVISEGEELAVVEAMKMQNVLRSARAGKIKKINVQPGNAVAADEIIIEIDDEVKTE